MDMATRRTDPPPRRASSSTHGAFAVCPIPGCNTGPDGVPHVFTRGTIGWDKHVGPPNNHLHWRRDPTNPDDRRVAFAEQFPAFFSAAKTPNRRPAPGDRIQEGTSKRLTPHYMDRVVVPPSTPPPPREEPGAEGLPADEHADLPARSPAAMPYKFCPHCGKRLPP